MADPNDDSTPGGDTPDKSGASVKTVPESDLIALKKTHEAEIAELKTQVETLTKDVTSERVAKEAAETLSSEIPTLRENITTITAERDAAKVAETAAVTKQDEMVASALTTRREFLKTTHKLDDAKVKDLDESQLSALEAILPDVSKAAATALNPKNLDLGSSNGSGDASKLTSRDKIAQGIASREP